MHTIALACVALEAQKDKNLPRTVTKTVTVTASPTGPTAPTYTQTSRLDNTSPYTVISQGGIQAPAINVRGGKLDLETDLLETTTTTTGHKAK